MDSIIFDVDGTLWDSTESVGEAWNQMIREHSDIEPFVDLKFMRETFGKTMSEIAQMLFPDLHSEERSRLAEYCFTFENVHLYEHPGVLYEGTAETVRRLSEKYPLFIVSNCQHGYIEALLETTSLAPYFQDHMCFEDTGKPKDYTLRALIARNNLKDPVYVGDTQGDADACAKAGVPFIFAAYGFGDVPEAKTRISQISDLLQLKTHIQQ